MIAGTLQAKKFAKLTSALDKNGFSAETQRELWTVISALLLLGNVTFEEGKRGGALNDLCFE